MHARNDHLGLTRGVSVASGTAVLCGCRSDWHAQSRTDPHVHGEHFYIVVSSHSTDSYAATAVPFLGREDGIGTSRGIMARYLGSGGQMLHKD